MELESLLKILKEKQILPAGSKEEKAMQSVSAETRQLCAKLNNGVYTDDEARSLRSEIVGYTLDDSFRVFLPFTADFGKHITIGKNVFINSGCRFQDQGGITIGEGSLIGHNVVMATANHDYDPTNRGTLHLKPIKLEKNTWIGSNVTILPGVTIGENSIVAAGSIVTKDVAPNTIVAGNPAKFMSDLADKIR